jgi:CheY-like chemotaxis protein
MTRKALLITQDKDLKKFIEISAMTLTKLNCQAELKSTLDFKEALQIAREDNLDLIFLDLDLQVFSPLGLIEEIRSESKSKDKKIIAFSEVNPISNRDEIFKSGCDSVMSKSELKMVVNNLLQY